MVEHSRLLWLDTALILGKYPIPVKVSQPLSSQKWQHPSKRQIMLAIHFFLCYDDPKQVQKLLPLNCTLKEAKDIQTFMKYAEKRIKQLEKDQLFPKQVYQSDVMEGGGKVDDVLLPLSSIALYRTLKRQCEDRNIPPPAYVSLADLKNAVHRIRSLDWNVHMNAQCFLGLYNRMVEVEEAWKRRIEEFQKRRERIERPVGGIEVDAEGTLGIRQQAREIWTPLLIHWNDSDRHRSMVDDIVERGEYGHGVIDISQSDPVDISQSLEEFKVRVTEMNNQLAESQLSYDSQLLTTFDTLQKDHQSTRKGLQDMKLSLEEQLRLLKGRIAEYGGGVGERSSSPVVCSGSLRERVDTGIDAMDLSGEYEL